MWLPEAAAQSWHRMNTLLVLHQFCVFTRTHAHVYFLQSPSMHNLPLEQNRHGYTHTPRHMHMYLSVRELFTALCLAHSSGLAMHLIQGKV